ncbi:hypothetical protein [Streptomyces microflavus]|uniref:hypothetical protein n=1 Tax=Streptomyces microflavus TaxID=1919 RepID=UPI00380B7E9A
MTLDELLTALGHADQALILPNGFDNPHSYRGYYDELAFEPTENITVADMAAAAWAAMDETFEGYKGGQYTMTGDTDCWLSYEGSAGGEEITTELLATFLAAGARPSPEASTIKRPERAEPSVHQQLVEMHESENLPAGACEDGALDVAAQHARELAALARTTGAASAEDIARFLEGHAAELDQKRTLLPPDTGTGRY